jgi:hypothetical protein
VERVEGSEEASGEVADEEVPGQIELLQVAHVANGFRYVSADVVKVQTNGSDELVNITVHSKICQYTRLEQIDIMITM